MGKKLRRWLALMMIPVIFTSCQLLPEEEVLPEVPVMRSYEKEEYEQVTVKRGDLVLEKTVPCTYVAAKVENLSFSLGGVYIDKIYVDNGQQVKKGELLAELEQENLKDQITAQEYELKTLQLKKEHILENRELDLLKYDIVLNDMTWEIEHTEGLRHSTLLVEKEELEEQRAEVVEEYAEPLQEIEDAIYIQEISLEESKELLKERQIYAGMDGTVTYVRKTINKVRSQKGQTIITISDLDTNVFYVKGNDAQYFPVGTEVTFTCLDKEYTAHVVDAAELGLEEAESNTEMAYLKLDQPDVTLTDGVTGRIQLILDSRTDVLYLEKEIVKTANDSQFVYVLDENGLRTMQEVTTGLVTSDYIEIVDGLEEGEKVIK